MTINSMIIFSGDRITGVYDGQDFIGTVNYTVATRIVITPDFPLWNCGTLDRHCVTIHSDSNDPARLITGVGRGTHWTMCREYSWISNKLDHQLAIAFEESLQCLEALATLDSLPDDCAPHLYINRARIGTAINRRINQLNRSIDLLESEIADFQDIE